MLRAIYKSGSACILPNSNDIDYIHYYDTNDERREALIKNKIRDKDIHFRLFSQAKECFLGVIFTHLANTLRAKKLIIAILVSLTKKSKVNTYHC